MWTIDLCFYKQSEKICMSLIYEDTECDFDKKIVIKIWSLCFVFNPTWDKLCKWKFVIRPLKPNNFLQKSFIDEDNIQEIRINNWVFHKHGYYVAAALKT